ncbi:MAG: hypothetical protein Q7R59_01415 [bacterium]|nr:hypothetical protein [bacterium]
MEDGFLSQNVLDQLVVFLELDLFLAVPALARHGSILARQVLAQVLMIDS